MFVTSIVHVKQIKSFHDKICKAFFFVDLYCVCVQLNNVLLMEQKGFESFHFVSNGRLNTAQLTVVNMYSREQVVCYDDPGIKSPALQFTYNQSIWECLSFIFQMLFKLSNAVNDIDNDIATEIRSQRDSSPCNINQHLPAGTRHANQ